MKLNILSDLHLEFAPLVHQPPHCDVAVLAGDLAPGIAGAAWAHDTFGTKGIPTMLVAGNHEFYGNRRLSEEYQAIKQAAKSASFLQNETVIYSGVRFVGATLWTDYDLYKTPRKSCLDAAVGIADYSQIMADEFHYVTPIDLLKEFSKSVACLESVLAQPFDGPTIVITHHAPTERSIAVRYMGDRLTPAFASDLEWLMHKYKPTLWVHGHVHHSLDLKVGETRIVCNPRGYPIEGGTENPDFDPNFIVEI